jgi:glycosyltransferase involved in cell wall biosynthesis
MSLELVCSSVAGTGEQRPESGWSSAPDLTNQTKVLTYEGLLPPLSEVLDGSDSLSDIRHCFGGLIDAYQEKLKEEKPDVVLVNGTYVVPWALMEAAHRLRLPVVHHYHGSLTKETEHWENEKHRRLMRELEASFDRSDTKFIFPSELTRRHVERNVFGRGLYRKRAIVLGNPVPEEFFNAQRQATPNRVGFVGRWTRIKNPAFLKKLADFNKRQGRPLNIHVVTDDASRLRAVKVLNDSVNFSPTFDTPAQMAGFYADMGSVLCPSHFETYGNVAQEAVAVGTPALVSKNMGIAEIFKKVGLGHLVVDFNQMQSVFGMLRDGVPEVSEESRRALREEVGAAVVHNKLLSYLKA